MNQARSARIDVDDSQVISVERNPEQLLIHLEQHRNNQKKKITIQALGSYEEHATYYTGHNVTAPHPNPKLPLNYIEYAAQGSNYLEMQGYLNNESWFAWRVVSPNITIT